MYHVHSGAFRVAVETLKHTLTHGQMKRQSMVTKMLALEVCTTVFITYSWFLCSDLQIPLSALSLSVIHVMGSAGIKYYMAKYFTALVIGKCSKDNAEIRGRTSRETKLHVDRMK